jgi:hypothetical protein
VKIEGNVSSDSLIDTAFANDPHFHGAGQQDAAFSGIDAWSDFNKFGLLCVSDGQISADRLWERPSPSSIKNARTGDETARS